MSAIRLHPSRAMPDVPATPYGRLLKCQHKYLEQLRAAPQFDTDSIIVAKENTNTGSRSYGITTPSALCAYLASLGPETPAKDAPSLYQVIVSSANTTSHRDIWLDIEYVKDKPSPLHVQLKRVQDLNVARVLRVLTHAPSHVSLACASGKIDDGRYKISFHVLLHFQDGPTYTASDMKRIVLESNARDCDLAVYGRSQCWRLPCCRKATDAHNRVFKIVDACSNPPGFVRATANRIADHVIRTVHAPGVARPGRPALLLAPSRPAPPWVDLLLHSNESPWNRFAPWVRPGAGHWKEGNRFYVMPLATACGMPCPIAGDNRRHKSNQSFILWDDHGYTASYRCHSLRCAGKRHDLIMSADQFNRVVALE